MTVAEDAASIILGGNEEPPSRTSLTPRQRRFIDEYLIDLNAARAAIRAGYSPNGAEVAASRLLGIAKVSEEVARRQAELSQEREIAAERVIRKLALLAFSNMLGYLRTTPNGDPYLDFSRLAREQAAALQEVTVEDFVDGRAENTRDVKRIKCKLADKRAALVDLRRHLGLFGQRVQKSGPDHPGGPDGAEKL